MTTFFQIIKKVLDVAYDELEGTNEEKDKKIQGALSKLTKAYGQIYQNGGPSYASAYVRFGYIFRYTSAHAEMIAQRVKASPAIKKILQRKKVAITCVGGGPGSDILGFFKYLIENKTKKPQVKFFLVDGESGWADSWADIDSLVSDEITTSKTFITIDVTKQEEWEKHKKPLQSDIFTFVFFLSELHNYKREATKYFKHLMNSANEESIFLIVDFNHNNNKVWADKLIEDCGLEVIEAEDGHSFRLSSEEERTDLGVYAKKFGYPKLTGDIFFRICKKN